MSQGVRERLIGAALDLFRHRGIAGTGVTEILEHSGVSRRSIYLQFPGGKAELAEAAVRADGEAVARLFGAHAQATTDLTGVLRGIADYWRHILLDSDFEAGCPIVAGALQGDQAPAARDTAGEVFRHWQELCMCILQDAGIPDERARSAAALTVAAVEGAVIVARAQRSLAPLDRVLDELSILARTLTEDDAAGR